MLGRLIRPVGLLSKQTGVLPAFTMKPSLAACFSTEGKSTLPTEETQASKILKVAAPNATDIDFVNRDFQEMKEQDLRLQYDKAYLKIMDAWQKPLEKKKRRQARIAEIKEAFVPPAEQQEKFVIHNPDLPVTVPAPDEETFAIVNISGFQPLNQHTGYHLESSIINHKLRFQYKVMKDDVILANYLEGYDINQQVIFDGVLLVGTKEYTLVGRPFVKSAKVYATVEEQTETDKLVVFKKRRRKTYQKTMHYRHMVTVLRVDKVEVEIDDALKSKAVALN